MSQITVGLDRENRVNGRCVLLFLLWRFMGFSCENVFPDRVLQGLQPPGGQDHLAETDCDNNNNGVKVMHR